MEKYQVQINNKEYLIAVEGDRVWLDGQEVHAGIHFLNDNGLFMIERDEGKREFHIVKLKEEDTYQVTTRGLQTDVIVQPLRKRAKREADKKNANIISAPIPGAVISVKVQEGESVAKNQVLVVLESMKMLMEFRAAFDGVVEKVLVSEGQMVEKGIEMVRLRKNK